MAILDTRGGGVDFLRRHSRLPAAATLSGVAHRSQEGQ